MRALDWRQPSLKQYLLSNPQQGREPKSMADKMCSNTSLKAQLSQGFQIAENHKTRGQKLRSSSSECWICFPNCKRSPQVNYFLITPQKVSKNIGCIFHSTYLLNLSIGFNSILSKSEFSQKKKKDFFLFVACCTLQKESCFYKDRWDSVIIPNLNYIHVIFLKLCFEKNYALYFSNICCMYIIYSAIFFKVILSYYRYF